MTNTVLTAQAAITANTPRASRIAAEPPLAIRFAILIFIIVLIVPVGLVSIGSGSGLVALPYEMFELAGRAPILFRTHMVASAMALLLAPLVVMVRHRPELHRPLGRLLGAFVVIGGLTALPVAIMSHSTPWARAGFFVQGLVWLYLLIAGYLAIRSGQNRRHARLMIAMLAVTTGAVWFRLMTGAAIALNLPFETVYALSAWIGWMAPFALVTLRPQLVSRVLAR